MANGQGSTFATASPAGELALAFYLACLWPTATGLAPHDQGYVLIALGFAGGITQLAAGIINLHKGNVLGNIMVAFSIFMFYGCIEKLGQVLGFIPMDTRIVDGWIFLVMGVTMAVYLIPPLFANKAALFFQIFTVGFFIPAALFFLTGQKFFWVIAGWDLPFMIVTIIYQATGITLNEFFHKEVMPMGKPVLTRKAS